MELTAIPKPKTAPVSLKLDSMYKTKQGTKATNAITRLFCAATPIQGSFRLKENVLRNLDRER